MKKRVEQVINEQIYNLEQLKKNNYSDTIIEISNKIVDTIRNGGKILIAGNGGSSADAQHFAAEMVGRFVCERKGYPAIALTTDSAIITAIANDYEYNQIFARQVEALGNTKDIFIGISTSGNSKNIIEAIKKAKEKEIYTIGLIGKDGGLMKEMCDSNILFNYKETARIQEHHLMTYHLICEYVEKELIKNNK